MEHPRITIVIPAYNAEDTIKETLNSVLAQSYATWNLIIVDDGSVDDTHKIAQIYAKQDARIKVVHQENRGSAGAYSTGVNNVLTEWVCICSADDILMPNHLEIMADAIRKNPTFDVFTSSDAQYLMPSGDIDFHPTERLDGSMREEIIYDVARRGLYGVGATYRKSMFDSLGGYTPGIYSEDHDFWLRGFAAGYRFMHIHLSTTIFRVSDRQKSADNDRVIKSQEEIVKRVLAGEIISDDIREGLIEGAAVRKAETDAYYDSLDMKGLKLKINQLKVTINNGPKILSSPLRALYHMVKKSKHKEG